MAETAKRLRKGLKALVSDTASSKLADQLDVAGSGAALGSPRVRPQLVPLSAVRPNPRQPRRTMSNEGVSRLADSIRRNGLIQPIVIRPLPADDPVSNSDKELQYIVKYELIAGERRWRAARVAGLSDVPALIRQAGEEQMLELALVENLQREDLNAMDRAFAYQEFRDRFGLGPEEIGRRVGEDRTTVTNYLRLLDLPAVIQEMVARGVVSMGHARALLGVADQAVQLELAKTVVVDNVSVRTLEDLVRGTRLSAAGSRPAGGAREKRAHIRDLERRFAEALLTKVTIRESRRKHHGRIIIEYNSMEDFDRISEVLGVVDK